MRGSSNKYWQIREDLGHHIKMFPVDATKTRYRKPNGYLKLNLSHPIQLAMMILRTIEKDKKTTPKSG
jgi:hypothetical protein